MAKYCVRRKRLLLLLLILGILVPLLLVYPGHFDLGPPLSCFSALIFPTERAQKLTPAQMTLEFPTVILVWTQWFSDATHFNTYQFTKRECPLPTSLPASLTASIGVDQAWCKFTHSRSSLPNATAIMFHTRDTQMSDLPPRLPSQKWILHSMESPVNDWYMNANKFTKVASYMRLFDYVGGYRFDADFHVGYCEIYDPKTGRVDAEVFDDFHERKRFSTQEGNEGESTVLWLASSCGSVNDRSVFVRELMQHIPVDSLGACLHTGQKQRFADTNALMRKYKFYLALENSHCEDYVTEKTCNAIRGGAIPIVAGPPGIDGSGYLKFEPMPGSFIHVESYKSVGELAALLRRIDGNETLWRSYHRFRSAPHESLSKAFVEAQSYDHADSGYCGMCRRAIRDRYEDVLYMRRDGELKGRKNFVSVDESCLEPGRMK